jgi:hypothetical protein
MLRAAQLNMTNGTDGWTLYSSCYPPIVGETTSWYCRALWPTLHISVNAGRVARSTMVRSSGPAHRNRHHWSSLASNAWKSYSTLQARRSVVGNILARPGGKVTDRKRTGTTAERSEGTWREGKERENALEFGLARSRNLATYERAGLLLFHDSHITAAHKPPRRRCADYRCAGQPALADHTVHLHNLASGPLTHLGAAASPTAARPRDGAKDGRRKPIAEEKSTTTRTRTRPGRCKGGSEKRVRPSQ